jgi:hypothetical protein
VDDAASSDEYVLIAFVEVLPTKSWRWLMPGWPGYTIGSSGSE